MVLVNSSEVVSKLVKGKDSQKQINTKVFD